MGTVGHSGKYSTSNLILELIVDIQTGNINLFTVRHDPGRVHFVLRGHKGPTSGLALSADEKKVYSAGWDGHALVSPTAPSNAESFN
jgi:hypothetical protein